MQKGQFTFFLIAYELEEPLAALMISSAKHLKECSVHDAAAAVTSQRHHVAHKWRESIQTADKVARGASEFNNAAASAERIKEKEKSTTKLKGCDTANDT